MTIAADVPASRAVIEWVAVTDGLWVASAEGDFVGTIERVEERYVAVDGRGATMGVNGSLAGARARFDPAALVPGRRRRSRRTVLLRLSRLAARFSRRSRRVGEVVRSPSV